MKKINFCAGPSKLPASVYQKLNMMIDDYKQSGLSLLSISHRDPLFLAVYQQIQQSIKSLLYLPDDYEILLMHGGATAQFSALAMNLAQNKRAAYFDTGYWSKKAIDEAKKFIDVDILPYHQSPDFKKAYDYVHYTENETIDGFQWAFVPETHAPLVADVSSSFLSKPIDIKRYGVLYAGAQKNIGLPGVAVVIIHQDLLARHKSSVPAVLDYGLTAKSSSLYNTPNVISWVSMALVLQDLIEQGGLKVIEKKNTDKAARLYQAIDQSDLFFNNIAAQNRSTMNVVFQVKKGLTEAFLAFAAQKGIYGLQGHRSVGGCRASLYNAVTLGDVDKLVAVIKEFENEC
ncbi:3-phosphoserine/phosphohydroxythreonine transaminase [Facilibium subflavum]|uniref:3-phosphoserine/phosphohydroxythreonine transaminase n=1 Tax=Facilibium subflavum TaxID=2219058 RepID=UPI000E64FD39|nr:3-phosphoserine/phosphohydroxythreonine transaminase [Facilibium subflavum]